LFQIGAQRFSASKISAAVVAGGLRTSKPCSTLFSIKDQCRLMFPQKRNCFFNVLNAFQHQRSVQGWDGMGWDGMGWDGMGAVLNAFQHQRSVQPLGGSYGGRAWRSAQRFSASKISAGLLDAVHGHGLGEVLNAFQHQRSVRSRGNCNAGEH